MLNNIFGSKTNESSKIVHCEITGEETEISNNTALVRINGIIALNNLRNPTIDFNSKLIHSEGKPSLEYYSELLVPDDLKGFFGQIFSIIDDLDEIEKSTAILSEEGKKIFSGQGLMIFAEHIKNGYEMIKMPETMFHTIIDTRTSIKTKECKNWNVNYNSTGNKYRYKNILREIKNDLTFGYISPILPGFDVAVSDCSDKNPNGTGYQFTTDQSYQKIDLCSNESAVDFCKKNKAIIYYNDFLNKGKLRILTSHTESINRNLQNSYLFRSSNI